MISAFLINSLSALKTIGRRPGRGEMHVVTFRAGGVGRVMDRLWGKLKASVWLCLLGCETAVLLPSCQPVTSDWSQFKMRVASQ